MIGDTLEEMMALYYGLGIGFLAGLQIMFLFLVWWFKKRGYFLRGTRGTKPNNNNGIDTAKASIMNITTAKASPDIASSLNCKNKTYITKTSNNSKITTNNPIKVSALICDIRFSLYKSICYIAFKLSLWVLLVQWYLIDLASMISSRRTHYKGATKVVCMDCKHTIIMSSDFEPDEKLV